ncbi:hypothetical protein HDU97_009216 [Phlyctochytrium planicorne]|nr:hypothetical protein HDU97_009216 [Phlyctochytrium planicorne]
MASDERVQLQQLIRELVVSESSPGVTESFDQISYTIKTIFQSGKEDIFAEQLNQFISRKEGEIERMCNFHYQVLDGGCLIADKAQEFVQSVDQLLKVRLGTVHLKGKVVDVNREMQEVGCKTIEKKKEIIDYRKVLQNIEIALEALQVCLFVLDISNKVSIQIDGKKYYSALRVMKRKRVDLINGTFKLLEDLENVHLKHIAVYDFSAKMKEFIPHQREQIRQAVCKEMTDWFVKVRENSRRLGKGALDAVRNRQGKENVVTSNIHKSSRSLDIINSLNNEEFHLDFKPLYQCLHIHDVLGKRKIFKTDFEENRKIQASIILNTQVNFNDGNLKDFETYISDIIGFFIVEAVVINSTQDFRSRTSVEGLWDNIIEKMNSVITIGLQDCQTPNLFLSIKILVIACIKTMESYGYPVNNLMTLMLSLFDRYNELMKFHCSEKIMEILEDDDYAPMIVESVEEYEEISKAFKIKEEKKFSLRFPRPMPFSKGFPQCCDCIKKFVYGFYQFADGFSQQNHEMDDLLKKSLENLLIQSLCNTLGRLLAQSTLPQAVQMLTNAEYFVLACGEFEQLLSERRATSKTKTSLHATTSFRDAKAGIEKRIFDLVNQKLDEHINPAIYDWSPATPPTIPSQYLKSKKSGINGSSLITGKTIKKLNVIFFDGFDIDLAYIDNYVRGLGDVEVGDGFNELRQVTSLLKSDTYEEFLVPAMKAKRYPRIQNATLISILEKIKASETSSFLTKLSNAEKAKRKSIDVVLKALKTADAHK